MLKLTIAAGLLALTQAACPNQCSGHGRCGEFDKCYCYKQVGLASPYKASYTGVDCSLRTCPTGLAYDSISSDGAKLTPVVYKADPNNDKAAAKLRVEFFPQNRDGAFARDQNFVVRIMRSDVAGVGQTTFTWKYEEDEYFEPETLLTEHNTLTTARNLKKGAANSGVYVWFDKTLWGNANTADNFEDHSGDIYTFSLTYNEGHEFNAADSNSAHQQLECSGRGACDYAGGKCKCFDGYTGEACQRTVCPNSCSGHGACQAEARFVTDANVNGATYAGAYDATQQYGCKCDAGYRGPDCSFIECSSGADPMGGEGGKDGRDCSGRGLCDYTSGVCKCFKGFYGERCESQTNFI